MPEPKQSPDGPASAPAATPETLDDILAEMRNEERPYGISPDRLRSYADRIEAVAISRFGDIRNLCQAEIDSCLSDHISAIFMLKVVRECADDQLRRLSQWKEARHA